MPLAAANPILRIYDEILARDFYVRDRGFLWKGEHRRAPNLPLCAFLSRWALQFLAPQAGTDTYFKETS